MTRIAVLGSNSFAGAGFVDAALTAGHTVLGINRSAEPHTAFLPYQRNARASAYRFAQLDLNADLPAICNELSAFEPASVVEFAGQGMVAESWKWPHQWYETNIVAKVRLHEFLRTRTWLSRYVRLSTPEVYGSTDQLIREDQPYAPSTPYAVSHAATDMSLSAYARNYGFPVVLTRFANFFGAGQQLYRIVPKTILYALSGRKLPLHGGGTSIRAFIHVRDVAKALLLACHRAPPGEVFHFSPSEFHSIRDVVQTVCNELGVDFAKVTEIAPDRAAKDQAYLMDASKARNRLDWQPTVSLIEGIRETIDWVKHYRAEFADLPWDYVHKP